MTQRYQDLMFSDAVAARQEQMGSRHVWTRRAGAAGPQDGPDPITGAEAAFIAARDNFYMATGGANGWPYLQHRGGPAGFVRVLDAATIGFADFRGNRQYISAGNLDIDDRASLIFMDYPNRARLKLLGRVAVHDMAEVPDLARRLALPGYSGHAERAFTIRVEAFEWNCPQHIAPRYTAEEIAPLVAEVQRLRSRVADLEAGVTG